MQKERWTGAVDSVGSTTLANVLSRTVYGGAVAACGLAGGFDLPASVMPHILRGVAAWARLARGLDRTKLGLMTRTEPLSRLLDLAAAIPAGEIRGRVVIGVAR